MQEIINLKHQKHFRYTIWSLQVLIKQGKDAILMLLHELLYLYFAIAFSLLVEFFNMKLRKKRKPVQLHGVQKEALDSGLLDE